MGITEEIIHDDELSKIDSKIFKIISKLSSQFKMMDVPIKYGFSEANTDIMKVIVEHKRTKLKSNIEVLDIKFNHILAEMSYKLEGKKYKQVVEIIPSNVKEKK